MFIFSTFSPILSKQQTSTKKISPFLDKPDYDETISHHHHDHDSDLEEDFSGYDHQECYQPPEIDEKEVVVLKDNNFTVTVNKNRFILGGRRRTLLVVLL
ncbi:protein disulfide isomerase-like 1-4-like [Trifolium medium]|uniref:Protein disulfide isomerase-like 1-4-like n=1 Tax=Trifolium medium TaxID=97028 RepID=A0A392LY75_9FABA|nr:protein disulfide isomerase-like 1-4-like [Trifolium medium]